MELSAKYRSSPNIAWIKYWGKCHEELILPINDSLGLTLNSDDINTETTITFSTNNETDTLLLNGLEHPLSKRVLQMFSNVKEIAYTRKYKDRILQEDWAKYHFKVDSLNSFPTASGMASSASGLACLAASLNGLFGNILSNEELSELARKGSGSASRSVYGGLVLWKGVPVEINTSTASLNKTELEKLSKECISFTAVAPCELKHIKVLILLANNKEKEVSSTSGMNHSVNTSELIKYRNELAHKRAVLILEKLKDLKDDSSAETINHFNTIVETIIKDSNQFHAICLDTYPPIFYLNEFSKQIISIVDSHINPFLEYKVAYTFDAGPHAFLFMHEKVELQVLGYFSQLFNLNKNEYNSKALEKLEQIESEKIEWSKIKDYKDTILAPYQIWSTDVGIGATRIN